MLPAPPLASGARTALTQEQPPVALYVHVPFCVSHCPYCDFVVVAGREARGLGNRIPAFLAAVHAELRLRGDAADAAWGEPGSPGRAALGSLYLGGGTPSLLPAADIGELIDHVQRRFGLEPDAEVTLEVNPGPDERGDLAGFRNAGVTRLSIGAQSLEPAELPGIGRRHTAEDVGATVAEARRAGVESVSVDLLYDIPGQTVASWSRSLERVLALEPDHVSAYALTLDDPDAEGLTDFSGDHLPVRAGARRWRERSRPRQDDDRAATMYELAEERLTGVGFAWYEISNWARPGHRSRHNLGYWHGLSFEAVGPGAHAFDGLTRRWNVARLDAYVAALAPANGGEPTLPPGGRQRLDLPRQAAERLILALRTADGVAPAVAADPRWAAAFRWAAGVGLITASGERTVLTTRGRLLANELFTRLT